MDSYTFNKIAGWCLFAALIILGGRYLMSDGDHSGDHKAEKTSYEIEVAKEEPKKDAGDKTADNAGGGVAALLANANPDSGAKVFKKCKACHTIDKGGANRVGPNLYNLVNRDLGSHAGFAYSDPMKAKGGKWDYAALEAFLKKPGAYVPGTKMIFSGIRKPQQLADLIAYLRAQADTPAPLP